MDWNYFNRFDDLINHYMPARGEGDTQASQIVTAVNKLVYKWYNDGDVYDNTATLRGWCNDLSSYANWLRENTGVEDILDRVYVCENDGQYERLLADLADALLDDEILSYAERKEKVGSIYDCDGPYKFEERYDDEEDEEDDDYEEDDYSFPWDADETGYDPYEGCYTGDC